MKPKYEYVPLDKQTKRKRKQYRAKQRRDWGEISPGHKNNVKPKSV